MRLLRFSSSSFCIFAFEEVNILSPPSAVHGSDARWWNWAPCLLAVLLAKHRSAHWGLSAFLHTLAAHKIHTVPIWMIESLHIAFNLRACVRTLLYAWAKRNCITIENTRTALWLTVLAILLLIHNRWKFYEPNCTCTLFWYTKLGTNASTLPLSIYEDGFVNYCSSLCSCILASYKE